MRMITMGMFLFMAACRPQFALLDEACSDKVPGQSTAPDNAVSAIWRVNCYRRLARMEKGRVDDRVSAADRAHAFYLDEHGPHPSLSSFIEDMTLSGATGEDPMDRVLAQGYDMPDNYSDVVGFWEGSWPNRDGLVPRDLVDEFVHNYHWRQVVLQPGWDDGGYGESNDWVTFTMLYEYPPPTHIAKPVLYPADGQLGVPTSWYMPYPDDPVPYDTTVGYPITVHVGSEEANGSPTDENPFALVLLEGRILGPNNQYVEFYTITPEATPYHFPYSVAMVPKEPLQSSSKYQVYAQISWNMGIKELTWEFTTRAEAASTTRTDPREIHPLLASPPRFGIYGE